MNNTLRLSTILCALALIPACSSIPSWLGGEKPKVEKLPGERITVLSAGSAITPDEVTKNVPVHVPPVNANSDWPQHTGALSAATGNLALGGNLENKQSVEAGKGEAFTHTLIPRPVIGGNTVFAMDAAGHISAHDAGNIENTLWKIPGLMEEDESDIMGGGLAYHDGRFYATSGRGQIAAYDAKSGHELWRKSLKTPFRSAPRIEDGRLFAITIDSKTIALNAGSGEPIWDHRGINETSGLLNSVSPAVAGNMVIVPYASGELYALSVVDGREIWSQTLTPGKRTDAGSVFSGIGGDPLIDEQVVFAVGNGGATSVFTLPAGQRLWERPIASINTPWIAGDFAFVLAADNTLICLIKYDGRIRWTMKLKSFEDEENNRDPITWRGPVLVGGKLALINSKGKLLLISAADGSIAAEKDIPDDIFTAPVIAGGKIYLVGKDATLYSFQ